MKYTGPSTSKLPSHFVRRQLAHSPACHQPTPPESSIIMSARLVRLLSVALLGACLTAPAIAKGHPRVSHPSSKSAEAGKGGTLIWRGDVATGNGVVNEVAQAWQRSGHGRIELQPFNTASGIDAVASGAADLAGSARPGDGSAEDASLTFTPVAWDGLVIITNPANPVRSLTLKQVHDVYYGKITNWSQLGGNNAPIDVYAVASPADGVEYSLRSLLFGNGNQPVAAPRLYLNMRQLEQGIQLNPNGFGAATLSDVSGNGKLRALAINGTQPTVANVADGSYPLFTALYLVSNPRSPKAAQVQAFMDFLQTAPAMTAMRNHAVLPYQDGSALAAMDNSRRSRILAEVGARASRIAPASTPISAPGATYAAGAAMAPTSANTLAAKMALERRNQQAAEAAAQKTELSGVRGSVAGVTVSSLARTKGSATTVKVGADAEVNRSAASHGKTYTVSKGDTLTSIARRHAIDVADLRAWNHIKGNEIRLGQQLRVSRD